MNKITTLCITLGNKKWGKVLRIQSREMWRDPGAGARCLRDNDREKDGGKFCYMLRKQFLLGFSLKDVIQFLIA